VCVTVEREKAPPRLLLKRVRLAAGRTRSLPAMTAWCMHRAHTSRSCLIATAAVFALGSASLMFLTTDRRVKP